jgi:hypothetical protein
MTDYRAVAMAWVAEPDHRPMVEAAARHLHANESLHLHDNVEGKEPCSYCWLRAAKAVQAIERAGQRIVAKPPVLPTWGQMSDLDKGAALLHDHKVQEEGESYATENYPAEYFDHPALLALDPAAASKHAQCLFGDEDPFDTLGAEEFDRLYDLALDADRKRHTAKSAHGESGEASC